MKHLALLISLLLSFSIAAGEKLRLIAEYNIATGEKFKETEIGGLSGIIYDSKTNRLLTISDDRSQTNDARFYEFDFKLDEKNFSVTPAEVIILKNKDGQPFKKMSIDFEGITLIGGDLFISSEGAINKIPIINPGVFRFTRDGAYKSELEIPEKFLATKGSELRFGVRDNASFEALSSTPDGKFIFLGTEESLQQDDKPASPKHESKTRIILYSELKPTKEFGYLLEKVPSIPVGGLTVGETGLVDIVAIDQNNFYSMERSYLPLAKRVIIRIFKNQIEERTTDISKIESLKEQKINTVTKTLLANVEDFGIKPDNVEGLCFGPKLPNGHQTLIGVSDNNFSKTQRTEFLAFEIIP